MKDVDNFVLDASITLAWCFSDESTLETLRLLEKLSKDSAFAPAIWPLEVGNILINAQKKKRITYAKITEFLSLLDSINIEIDNETGFRGFREILALSHSEKITTYDAAYLELAMRLGLPLATKDAQLRDAALKLGVRVLPH